MDAARHWAPGGVVGVVGETGNGTGIRLRRVAAPGAEPVEVGTFYTDLLERGYAYGPAFQGLRAVWRRGDEVFAEAVLPEEQREEAGKFGMHPALLDAALRTNAFANPDDDRQVLPFAWNGLVLHAVGASALRVRVARADRTRCRSRPPTRPATWS